MYLLPQTRQVPQGSCVPAAVTCTSDHVVQDALAREDQRVRHGLGRRRNLLRLHRAQRVHARRDDEHLARQARQRRPHLRRGVQKPAGFQEPEDNARLPGRPQREQEPLPGHQGLRRLARRAAVERECAERSGQG